MNIKIPTILFVLLFSLFYNVRAQDRYEIFVESFEENINDMAGRLDLDEKTYHNKYAVLKIKTPNCNEEERSKFVFEADMGTTIINPQEDATFIANYVGEIRLYVETCLRQLIIKHPDFGEFVYRNEKNLRPLMVYDVNIMVNRPATAGVVASNANVTSNYVEINILPQEIADKVKLTIDDEYVPVTLPFTTPFLTTEKEHHIVVEYDMYHTYEGIIYASKNEKKIYNIELSPAFGKINIRSLPEEGAIVFIDGRNVGKTPFVSEKLASGEHEVELMKELYLPLKRTVKVIDGNTSNIELEMKPNFGKLTLTTADENKDVSFYVDNNFKGKGLWNGRLTPGEHRVEARLERHKSTSQIVTINLNENKNIKLENPMPIYGNIDIKSDPTGVEIYLDGKKLGTTPYFTQVLIGNHELEFKKDKYEEEKVNIWVDEGKTTSKSVSLKEKKASKVTLAYTRNEQKPKNSNLSSGGHSQFGYDFFTDGTSFITANLDCGLFNSFGLTYSRQPEVGFGWFVSLLTNGDFSGNTLDYSKWATPLKTKSPIQSRVSAIAGLNFAMGPLVFRAGLGYGYEREIYESTTPSTTPYAIEPNMKGDEFEWLWGVTIMFRHLVLSFDYVTPEMGSPKDEHGDVIHKPIMRFGIGYAWRHRK